MEMKSSEQSGIEERLEIGQRFQDHCAYVIQKHLNITIGNFQSIDYQYKLGENAQGFEIKYDRNFVNTNNLWIEVRHRRDTEEPYYAGGILRQDNSWLYCIGDYNVLYIFSVRLLRKLYNSRKYRVIENGSKTSWGMLLPKADAEEYYSYKIETPEGCVAWKVGNA